jgi:membrane fusion protein, multidrug efflux system
LSQLRDGEGHLKTVRYVIAVLGGLVILGSLGFIKYSQIAMLISFGEAMAAAGPPPEVVATDIAKDASWESEIPAVGSISAGRGVVVSNEVPGEVRAIRFDSGDTVKQGQVLVEIDSSVERAQLRSAVARRSLARTQAERTRKLVAEKAVTQAQLDTDEAQLESANADVAALQAQIDRKTVRAPFAGKLGIRAINLGQYLTPGTMITELQSAEAVFVDFSLPQQELRRIAVGMKVRITGDNNALGVEAPITAIDPTLDAVTRSIKVRARIDDKAAAAYPGMFVNVAVVLPEKKKVVAVPATAVVHAPYGNSVFVVEDRKDGQPGKAVRQQFVKTGETRGDFIAILEGVKANQEVVVSGAFKLRNNAPVTVNNTVKPKAELTPKVENR